MNSGHKFPFSLAFLFYVMNFLFDESQMKVEEENSNVLLLLAGRPQKVKPLRKLRSSVVIQCVESVITIIVSISVFAVLCSGGKDNDQGEIICS